MKIITSASNPEIKRLTLLNKSSRRRREEGCFCIEGLRLLKDAADSGVTIEKLYFTKDALEKRGEEVNRLISRAQGVCEISQSVMEHLSETKTPQGVFGVCKMDTPALTAENVQRGGKYVMLENVQDPSNIGAVARTAEALGISGLLLAGCCDIFSPKSMRASMGAFFRLPVLLCADAVETAGTLRESGVFTFACVPDRNARDVRTLNFDAPCVAVIGNEGNGISEALLCVCGERVTVPMAGRAESLNAANAATIVMWEMARNGR